MRKSFVNFYKRYSKPNSQCGNKFRKKKGKKRPLDTKEGIIAETLYTRTANDFSSINPEESANPN